MNRLAAALAYVPRGVICGRCKVHKPPADYSRGGVWCRACYQCYARQRRKEARP